MSIGRLGKRGMSLIELTIYAGVSSVMAILVARLVGQSPRLTTTFNGMLFQQTSYNQTNVPVTDLLSAVAVSISWNAIDPSQSTYDKVNGPGTMPWFQIHDPAIAAPLVIPISHVCYRYDPQSQSLLRFFISGTQVPADQNYFSTNACNPQPGDNAVKTVIAQNVMAPTLQTPLFSKDTAASNMVVFTIQVQSAGTGFAAVKPLLVQRRVYIPS